MKTDVSMAKKEIKDLRKIKVHRNVKTKMACLGTFLSTLSWACMSGLPQWVINDPKEKVEGLCAPCMIHTGKCLFVAGG